MSQTEEWKGMKGVEEQLGNAEVAEGSCGGWRRGQDGWGVSQQAMCEWTAGRGAGRERGRGRERRSLHGEGGEGGNVVGKRRVNRMNGRRLREAGKGVRSRRGKEGLIRSEWEWTVSR